MSIRIEPGILTVPFEVLEGFPKEGYSPKFNATVELKCAWADRAQLAREFQGSIVNDQNNQIRLMPHQYPDNPQAFVDDVKIDPYGGSTKDSTEGGFGIVYKDAKLTVTYSIPPQNFLGDQDGSQILTEERFETSSELISVAVEGLRFQNGTPLAENSKFGFPIIKGLWVYERKEIAALPFGSMDQYVGKVNSKELKSKRISQFTEIDGNKTEQQKFPAGTLLYLTPVTNTTVTNEGEQALNATWQFAYKPDGWNTFYPPVESLPVVDNMVKLAPEKILNSDSKEVQFYQTADWSHIIV